MYSDFGGEVYLRRLAKVANCSRSSLDNWVESVENSSFSSSIFQFSVRGEMSPFSGPSYQPQITQKKLEKGRPRSLL